MPDKVLGGEVQLLQQGLRELQGRVWTLEHEVDRMGGNHSAKYYHEDYVDDLQSRLDKIAEVTNRADTYIGAEHVAIDNLVGWMLEIRELAKGNPQ